MSNASGQAGIPSPAVGLGLPVHPAVQAAEDQLAAAKEAHRASPTEQTAQAKAAAALELRYQRWVARGGPAQAATKATEAFHARYNTSEG